MSACEGQDQFQPVVNRRAGYSDQLNWALKMARKGGCLGAGEGLLLVEHYEERLAAVEAERDALRERIALAERMARVVNAVREYFNDAPDDNGLYSAWTAYTLTTSNTRAAVAAAEQEVNDA